MICFPFFQPKNGEFEYHNVCKTRNEVATVEIMMNYVGKYLLGKGMKFWILNKCCQTHLKHHFYSHFLFYHLIISHDFLPALVQMLTSMLNLTHVKKPQVSTKKGKFTKFRANFTFEFWKKVMKFVLKDSSFC